MKLSLPAPLLLLALNLKAADGALRGSATRDRQLAAVSGEDKDHLVQEYDLKDDAPLPVQYISSASTVTVKGRDYSLEGLSEFSVLAPDFKSFVDGEEVVYSAQSSLWSVTDSNGASIMLMLDEAGDVAFIQLQDGSQETSLFPMHGSEYGPGAMVAISANDYEDHIFPFDEDEGEQIDDSGYDDPDAENILVPSHRVLQSCNTMKAMDVAIAYDSSFCKQYGGTAAGAQSRIEAIIAMTSKYYEVNGLCTKLRISYVEGSCDPAKDQYKEDVSKSNLLDLFRRRWSPLYRESQPRRAVAALFSGTDYTPNSNKLGDAYTYRVCNPYWGYSVNYMTSTNILSRQAILFAHELGHNSGVFDHVGAGQNTGHIMNKSLNDARNGFSSSSISTMSKFFGTLKCLETLPAETPNTEGGEGSTEAPTDEEW